MWQSTLLPNKLWKPSKQNWDTLRNQCNEGPWDKQVTVSSPDTYNDERRNIYSKERKGNSQSHAELRKDIQVVSEFHNMLRNCVAYDYAQVQATGYSSHSPVVTISINLCPHLHKILHVVIDICTLPNDRKIKFLIQILKMYYNGQTSTWQHSTLGYKGR